MCGRYFRHTPRDELAAAFAAQSSVEDVAPGFNIAPSQSVLAVRFNPKSGLRTLDALSWGLVPHFVKDRSGAYKLINARAETVDVLPSYRDAFLRRRCLVLADGFYEWRKLGKKKQPYAIARVDRAPFAMAGLWENFRDPATGDWFRTCTVVTTNANALVAELHDRMPAILPPEAYAAWLGETPCAPAELKRLLTPFAAEQMQAWPVSPALNRPGTRDDAGLLEPVSVSEDGNLELTFNRD